MFSGRWHERPNYRQRRHMWIIKYISEANKVYSSHIPSKLNTIKFFIFTTWKWIMKAVFTRDEWTEAPAHRWLIILFSCKPDTTDFHLQPKSDRMKMKPGFKVLIKQRLVNPFDLASRRSKGLNADLPLCK